MSVCRTLWWRALMTCADMRTPTRWTRVRRLICWQLTASPTTRECAAFTRDLEKPHCWAAGREWLDTSLIRGKDEQPRPVFAFFSREKRVGRTQPGPCIEF